MIGAKMKKLNTSNAFAMLALGFTLVVVAAGFGTNSVSADSQLMSTPTTKATKTGSSDSGAGNGTTKSAPTTIAKSGSSDGGSGNGSSTSSSVKSAPTTIAKSAPTTIAKTGSSDGGTGKSVTVSDSELTTSGSTCFAINSSKYCTTLTKVQMNALTSAQWETVDGYLSSSQVASIPTKTIKNLSTTALTGLTSDGTKALTTAQLKVMSKDQLNALVSSGELTDTQLDTVNKKLKQLG
jgi:hypothetical protein